MTSAPGRALMVLVAGTMFMEILDGTVLSVAAPAMARSFGVESAAIAVAITAYLITLAALIPVSGWLADRYGTRTIFLAAIALFSLSSLACAASTNLAELTALRVGQGVGGAMMVPVGRAVVLRGVPRAGIVRAMAFLTWPALVAPIVAPLIGGWFVSYTTWRWIFIVNVPLGVLAIVAGLRLVPQQAEARRVPLDRAGFALGALASSAVVVLAAALGARTVSLAIVAVSAVAAFGFGASAGRHLLSTRHPLLDLRLFTVATYRLAHTGGSLERMTIQAVPFLLPLLFQDGFGWTPIRAGAIVLWLFVGNLGIKPATTGLLRWLGFRRVLVGSALLLSASIAVLGLLTRGTPVVVIAGVLVVSGAARSVGMTVVNTVAFADIDEARMAPASTLSLTLTQLALGLGVALGAVCLRVGQAASFGVGGATPSFRVAFLLLALAALVSALMALRLDRRAGVALLAR